MTAPDQAPDEGQEPAVVETEDGAEHVGELPAEAAVEQPHRPGWYRSTSGAVAHADGPSQVRAYADRGWTPIDQAEAQAIIAAGVQLVVSRTDTEGTFDAESVARAVRDEAPPARRRRG